ncbi:MAG: transglutaminase-like putative cysteine protease [Candidatus Aldehydirespiratoraceae bacterium]|jgi:transglutaminase-like putative cysteine protease
MNQPTEDARTRTLSSDALATLALFAYSAVVATGFTRVFSGWDFLDNLLVVVFVGHGVSFALRSARAPIWVAFPATTFALAWMIGAMYYRETYSLLLPTSETWDLFRLELDLVSEQFRTAVAPVAFLAGWDVLASLGIAAAVLLADTFAFRAFARAESLVPGGVLFVFVAALGTDRSRIVSTMVLVASGVVATVILRQHHAPDSAPTIGMNRIRVSRALPAAAGSALCIALIAGVIGPRLPGAGAEPIYETKGGNGGSVTEVISPLVDIRSRLTNRTTTELFTVRADTDSYWRSSALPKFDGVTWGLPERGLSRADGTIGTGTEGAVEIRQQIQISALGGALLPAAADPIAANALGDLRDNLRFNSDSATLVKTGNGLKRGDTFEVMSASPRYSSATLAAATSVDPGDSIYFELPDNFPTAVGDTAREITAGATSSYDAALTLQNWMRTEFTYSLEIQEGHGNNAIESFLQNRVGYCEQFAGSYAAMMRSIDVPARVAVGFTQGASDGQGNYSVLGRNAHAWPEVWFDNIGWVPFEPTPGRGAPNAEEYTGVSQQQDEGPEGGDDATSTTEPPTTTPTPATSLVDGQAGAPPTTLPSAGVPGGSETPLAEASATSGASTDGIGVPWSHLALIAVLALVLASPAIIRRVRRQGATRSSSSHLAMLWTRAMSALTEMGLDPSPDLTPAETALATSDVFPVAARPMQSLAEAVTHVNFAPHGAEWLDSESAYGTTTLQNCASWCRQVERAVSDSLSLVARIRRYFTVWA